MKRRNVFTLIKGMLSLVGKHVWLIVLAVIVGTLGFFAAMGITFFAGLSIANGLGLGISISFGLLIALILISGFARGGLRFVEQYLNHFMAFTLLADVRNKVFHALRKQGSKVLDDRSKGDILSILQSDTESLEVFYAHTITPFFIAIFVETGVLIALGLLCGYQIMLIGLASYLIIGFLVPTLFYLSNRKLGKEYRKALAESESKYLNHIYGVREVVTFAHQEDAKKEIAKVSSTLNAISKKLNDKAARFSSITNLLISLFDILVIIVATLLYQNGVISSATTVMGYAIIVASFGPVVALANLPGNLTMSFASAERVLDIVEAKPQEKEGGHTFVFDSLKLENVEFGYNENKILNNVSLALHKGEVIGIKGKSGSGKSTLLKLLLRFERPTSGKVLYNNEDIETYSREALSSNVVLFSQSTYLFQMSYADNLRIAKEDATIEELKEACKKAGILDYIEKTPKGFDTIVNDRQDNLSTGEKQRLGLARVFLSGAPLLLLDEATSNVDAKTEAHILKSLLEEKEDKAILLVSHRDSTLSICDKIYTLEEGFLTNA
ncbi:MAG: ABC transporter ATP-binding protein/permease [Bacilli bacterium]|nr:ABC transporter ATP-binding protein/permease [Bacilli bacterium]